MGGHDSAKHHMRELERARASAERLEILLGRRETVIRPSGGMNALERVAGELATYFRDLLDEISGYAKVLQRGIDYKDPMQAYARSIVTHAETGKRLAARLLAFDVAGTINPTLVNINHFVRDLAHLASGLTDKGIRLRTVLTNHDLTVAADPARLGHAFVSLIKHGCAFISGKGTMTVRTDLLNVASGVVSDGSQGSCALLSIKSTQESQDPGDEISLPGKGSIKGIHLGFTIIRKIIEEHRGAFRIGGQRGRTMEFKIYLPVTVSPRP